jgi:hypothetical protein
MGPQSGDHPQEDLAKFIYKLNLKIISEKHHSVILATYFNYA